MSAPSRSRGAARKAARAVRRAARQVGRRGNGNPGDAERFGHLPLFDWPFYTAITDARLRHLESLELPVDGKSVIDVGSGIGRLSEFFAARGCDVMCVDGREENIQQLKQNYPERRAAVVDVETDELLEHGEFDVVFCYGLLYHLADPMAFLRRAASICRELMIVETCITDAEEPVVFLVQDPSDPTMALHTLASRPSPAYVVAALRLGGFQHVYSPLELPRHEDFMYPRKNDYGYLRRGKNLRDIFVASRSELQLPTLRAL